MPRLGEFEAVVWALELEEDTASLGAEEAGGEGELVIVATAGSRNCSWRKSAYDAD